MTAEHLDQVLHPQFAGAGHAVLAKGLPPHRAPRVGAVVLHRRRRGRGRRPGRPVILVRTETSPEDVHGMMVAEAILTARGGLVSHAAVVARGWGKPAVVGAEAIRITDDSFTVGDDRRPEGRRHLRQRHHR